MTHCWKSHVTAHIAIPNLDGTMDFDKEDTILESIADQYFSSLWCFKPYAIINVIVFSNKLSLIIHKADSTY